jgi:diacylglycerol kinase family enzyme
MNVAGMALDGRVVERFPAAMRNNRFLPGYLIAGLRQLFVYRAPHLWVELPDTSFDNQFITLHAGIGRYSGGGMQFVPHAKFSAETLAITCIQRMSTLRLLANIYRLYLGNILDHPKAKGLSSPWLKVSSRSGEPVPVEADGEFLGYTPVQIEIIPAAFRLVVPKLAYDA